MYYTVYESTLRDEHVNIMNPPKSLTTNFTIDQLVLIRIFDSKKSKFALVPICDRLKSRRIRSLF
jgi:hypothetical protein